MSEHASTAIPEWLQLGNWNVRADRIEAWESDTYGRLTVVLASGERLHVGEYQETHRALRALSSGREAQQ